MLMIAPSDEKLRTRICVTKSSDKWIATSQAFLLNTLMATPPPLPPPLSAVPPKKGMNVGCIIGLVLGIGIFIIGILAALAVPAATGVMKRAKQVRTHAAMKDLRFGLINYHTEYARFPATDSEVMVSAEGALLKALMGQGEHNPRQVVFLDVPLAVGGKNGLLVKGDDETLVDAWGQTYRILTDVDGNGSIASPEPQQKPLTEAVLVWSAGEDGDFDTWEDNLASWKPFRARPD